MRALKETPIALASPMGEAFYFVFLFLFGGFKYCFYLCNEDFVANDYHFLDCGGWHYVSRPFFDKKLSVNVSWTVAPWVYLQKAYFLFCGFK